MLFMVCVVIGLLATALSLAEGIRAHADKIVVTWHYFIPYAIWLFGTILIQRNIERKLANRDPWIFPPRQRF